MIPYPPNPTAYVSTPWLDEATGISWLWAQRGPDINGVPQGKWGRAPSSGTLTQAYTESETPPEDKTKLWYDPGDGTVSAWNAENQVWVQVSGASASAGYGQRVIIVPLAEQMLLEPYAEEMSDVLYVIETAVPAPTTRSVILNMPGVGYSRVGQQITVFTLADITSFAVNEVAHGDVVTSIFGYTLGPAMPISFICYKKTADYSYWLRLS